MNKRYAGRGVGMAALAVLVLVGIAGICRAAGEWEWTAGQGWVMGAGVSRPTPKEQLAYAYELEQRGEFMDSARQYFLLVQNFPDSQEAGIGLQRLARCLFEMENYYTSYKAIEQVIKTYPNTGRMSDLVAIELSIAKKMMLSQTPDILNPNERDARASNVRRGLEIISSVIEHDPYGPAAAEAYLVRGEGNLFIGEINTARTAFESVRDEFPRSDFVERAKLGILRCDSLVGEAKPQELLEQIDVVRGEEETRRKTQPPSEFDDDGGGIEGSLRQLAEVEAGKMMQQAEQYRRMGTRSAVQSSEFLYKEVVRRYPGTPQSEEAMAKLGNIRVPAEKSRLSRNFKKMNLNPFSWNKDPEPPWIVPQMNPEDMVMVDNGIGPIVGVPETGLPQTMASAGVRPAALGGAASADLAMGQGGFSPAAAGPDGALGFSPASAAPGGVPAPAFIDGVGEPRVYTSAPPQISAPASPYPEAFPARANPLPSISDSDLIAVGGAPAVVVPQRQMPTTSYGAPYAAPAPSPAPISVAAPLAPPSAVAQPPVLGALDYNAPVTDLVGPARRDSLSRAPLPESMTGGYLPPISTVPQPAPQAGYSGYQGYGAGNPPPAGGGSWTLGEDFR